MLFACLQGCSNGVISAYVHEEQSSIFRLFSYSMVFPFSFRLDCIVELWPDFGNILRQPYDSFRNFVRCMSIKLK